MTENNFYIYIFDMFFDLICDSYSKSLETGFLYERIKIEQAPSLCSLFVWQWLQVSQRRELQSSQWIKSACMRFAVHLL